MATFLRLAGAILAVAALAFAITRLDAGSVGTAAPRAVSASGAAGLVQSVTGDAVVRAGALRPGQRVTGTVTIENAGDATGLFTLAQTDVLDTPGTGGGRLSRALRLRIDDPRALRPVYQGPLGAMDPKRLGYLRAGQRRTYRFTLTFPGRADADALGGSRVETTFDWTAATADPPVPDPSRDRTPPVVLAQVVGRRDRTVIVALTCSERCRVVGLPRGARSDPRQRLLPGRPVLQTLRLRDGAVPLRVTVTDAGGNRATVSASR